MIACALAAAWILAGAGAVVLGIVISSWRRR